MATAPTPPGWYPDPDGSGGRRYFDGSTWTAHRTPPIAPPVRPPAKRSSWPWVLLAVVVLLFGGCAALLGMVTTDSKDLDSNSASGGSSESRSTSEANGLHQEVRDGQFAFVVTSLARTDGSMAALLGTPRGEWRLLMLTVTNTGDRPQSFFMQNQKLIDTAGREYAADSSAAYALNEDTSVIDLNPGFSQNFTLPFDVPVGTEISEVKLHDSMFSNGATVIL